MYCLPGNHDLTPVMSDTFDGRTVSMETSVRHGAWHLVFLDSTVPGEDGGHLDTGQLARLRDVAGGAAGRPHPGLPPPPTGPDRQRLDGYYGPGQPRSLLRDHRPSSPGARDNLGPRPPGVRRRTQRRAATEDPRPPAFSSSPAAWNSPSTISPPVSAGWSFTRTGASTPA